MKPSARIFFETNTVFFNSEILIHYLFFCAYKLFNTHNGSKDITGHLLMKNLFENVHTVREEEATWGRRLPCAFFQSLPSGIPLPQSIKMLPYSIHQNSGPLCSALHSKVLRLVSLIMLEGKYCYCG